MSGPESNMSIDIRILRDLDPPLFAGLDEPELEALAQRLATVNYRPQELIFSRGDPSDFLLIIAEGRLRLSLSRADGREISFRVAGP